MSDSMAHVVFVVRNDLTRDNRIEKMAAALTEVDLRVTLLGLKSSPDQPDEEDVGPWRVRRIQTVGAMPNSPEPKGVGSTGDSAVDTFAPYRGRLGALRHFFGRFRESVLFFLVVRQLRPDVVVLQNPDLGVCALLVHSISRRPFVYDSRELWVEQNPRWHPWFKGLYGWLERRLVLRAARVITVNAAIASELSRRYGRPGIDVVHNGPSECSRSIPGVGSPVRLFFQGAFASDRDLDVLVRAMSFLRGRAILTMQGFGPEESALRDLVRQLDLDDTVRFLEPCLPRDVIRSAAGQDVGVISYRPSSLNLLLSSPNKLFDYLGAGLAIAGPDIPFIRSLIDRHGCGTFIDPATPASLAAGLDLLLDRPDSIVKMKQQAHAACSEYSWDVERHAFTSIVQGTLRQGRGHARL